MLDITSNFYVNVTKSQVQILFDYNFYQLYIYIKKTCLSNKTSSDNK